MERKEDSVLETQETAAHGLSPQQIKCISLILEGKTHHEIGTKELKENKKAITMEVLQFDRSLYGLLLQMTISAELKRQLNKMVSESKSAEERIKNDQATDDEVNSIIQDLTIRLKSVTGMISYYKPSLVNVKYLELLSMTKVVVFYFNGVCENLLALNDRRLQNLKKNIATCMEDINNAIAYFDKLTYITYGTCVGAVVSGIATVILIKFSSSRVAVGVMATVAIGCAAGACTSYYVRKKMIEDGEAEGSTIIKKQIV